MKLTSSEIKFLRDHRQDMLNGKLENVFNDFAGSHARLIQIFKELGVDISKKEVSTSKSASREDELKKYLVFFEDGLFIVNDDRKTLTPLDSSTYFNLENFAKFDTRAEAINFARNFIQAKEEIEDFGEAVDTKDYSIKNVKDAIDDELVDYSDDDNVSAPREKLNIVKMRFPTIDDYYDMLAHLRRYYDHTNNNYWWYFILDTHTNEFKAVNYANGDIEDFEYNESAFRPVLEIPNLTKVYPNNAVGDFIPIESDYMGTTSSWIEIDDDKVIYAGKLHNIILDDADLEIRDWFKNIKELNR